MRTRVYTRFFSSDLALRINSENGVDSAGFDLNKYLNMGDSLRQFQQALKLLSANLFRYMVVNLVYTGLVEAFTVVIILHQKV